MNPKIMSQDLDEPVTIMVDPSIAFLTSEVLSQDCQERKLGKAEMKQLINNAKEHTLKGRDRKLSRTL
jgi:hypothetical protein